VIPRGPVACASEAHDHEVAGRDDRHQLPFVSGVGTRILSKRIRQVRPVILRAGFPVGLQGQVVRAMLAGRSAETVPAARQTAAATAT
jgi:hypothetical protein